MMLIIKFYNMKTAFIYIEMYIPFFKVWSMSFPYYSFGI